MQITKKYSKSSLFKSNFYKTVTDALLFEVTLAAGEFGEESNKGGRRFF